MDRWRVTAGRNVGNFKTNYATLKVPPKLLAEQYVALIHYLVDHYQSQNRIMSMNVENFFTTKALKTGMMYIFDDSLPICDYKYNSCSVNPKGEVQFCTSWQSRSYGNAFTSNIEKIWQSDEMRKMKELKIGSITQCLNCELLQYCGGGCRVECTSLEAKDDNACASFEVFNEYILPVLKSLGIRFSV